MSSSRHQAPNTGDETMKVQIIIAADNAAFHESEDGTECARILRELSDKIENMAFDGGEVLPLMDHNGNRVGSLTTEK